MRPLLNAEFTMSFANNAQSLSRLVFAVFALSCFSAGAAEPLLVPAEESVGGMSQSEWSKLWWQWAGSFQRSESPIADRTGDLCASKQSGDVWFLAGTYGTKRTVRTCRVPAGKYLFFPLINYIVARNSDGSASCTAVMDSAARRTEEVSSLVLDIDGVTYPDLVKHRQATTECFDFGAKAVPQTRIFPSAANGYYVMLKPLSPGEHTLNFGGVLPSMLQAVTYTLIVE
jgi:hypothetical protein